MYIHCIISHTNKKSQRYILYIIGPVALSITGPFNYPLGCNGVFLVIIILKFELVHWHILRRRRNLRLRVLASIIKQYISPYPTARLHLLRRRNYFSPVEATGIRIQCHHRRTRCKFLIGAHMCRTSRGCIGVGQWYYRLGGRSVCSISASATGG